MLNNNASLKDVMDTFEQINNKIIDRGGAKTVTPSTVNQVLPKGNYKGDITIVGDSDLKPENIKQGVNIFGINGTLPTFTEKFKQKTYVSKSEAIDYSYEDIDGFILRKINDVNYLNADMDRNNNIYLIGSKNKYIGGVHKNHICIIDPNTFKVIKEVEFTGSTNGVNTTCFCLFNGTSIKYYRIYLNNYLYLQELNIETLAVIKTVKLTSNSSGIFGSWDPTHNKGRVFTIGSTRFRELDPETFAIIRETQNAKNYTYCDTFFDHNKNKYRLFAMRTDKTSVDELNIDTFEIIAHNVRTVFKGYSFSTTETKTILYNNKEYVSLY